MKKLILVVSILSFAPLAQAEPINLKAIAQIESSGNPLAVGDRGKALGLYQLHKCVIDDYNARHNTRFSHKTALDSVISGRIANWYLNSEIPRLLRHYGLKDTTENRLMAWNRGIGAMRSKKPVPEVTKKYFKKYKELA